MKKIIGILAMLMMLFTLSSCVTAAQAQVDAVYDVYDDDVDVNVVITYGTPYYNAEGLLLYYMYRDMFYYPYIYNNMYYFHRYSRPLPYNRYYRYYRPLPRDFHRHHSYGRGHHEFGRNHRFDNHRHGNIAPPRGNGHQRPNIQHNGHNRQRIESRPMTPQRRLDRPNHGTQRPNFNVRPRTNGNMHMQRPSGGFGRSGMSPSQRSSTRATNGGHHGNFGGRR